MTTLSASTEWLAAREAIREAIYFYCTAIDRRQYDRLGEIFHAEATIRVGAYEGLVQPFIDSLASRNANVLRAVHMIGNVRIEALGPSAAFAESYCLAVQQFPPEPPAETGIDRVLRLRYADHFTAAADGWKIAHRLIVVDHASAPTPAASESVFTGPQGAPGADDPAVRMRAALVATHAG